MSESKSARCDRSHSGHSPIEYRRGSYYSALSAAGASAVAFVERRERRVLGAAFLVSLFLEHVLVEVYELDEADSSVVTETVTRLEDTSVATGTVSDLLSNGGRRVP